MTTDTEAAVRSATTEKERAELIGDVHAVHLALAKQRHGQRLALARRMLDAGRRVRTAGPLADAQRACEYIDRGEPAAAVVALSWADLHG
jgi:hypothetical protein